MKNRKIGQFIRENALTFYFTFLGLLISFTVSYAMCGFSLKIKLFFLVTCVICFAVGLLLLFKRVKTYNKQKLENEKKRLQELEKLKEKYRYYVGLVARNTTDVVTNLKKESYTFDIDYNHDYLFAFSDNLSWVCNNRIIGKPDSFIIATCLMYGILSNPVIICSPGSVEPTKDFIFNLNLTIAIHCVSEIISEPITYFENDGNWIEEKHPRKEIIVPIGLISDSPLSQRILNSICYDEIADNRTSIMLFSNLLHLIYLSCP